LIRNSRKLNAKEMVMSRKLVPWLAVVILLISVGDARAQRGGGHHGAVGGHYGGGTGFHHPGNWGAHWGYPVYDYPVWGGDWYGMGYDHGAMGLGDLYAGQGAFLQGAGAFILNEAMAEALQDLQISPPRTLGTLVGFMTAHNLRFGPAQTIRQRKAHQDFYPILADALQKVLAASRNGDQQVAMQAAGDEAGRPE